MKCGSEFGEDTYDYMQRHLASVGCQTWVQQSTLPQGDRCFSSVYIFGVDAGPGNIGALPRSQKDLEDCTFIMYTTVFCICHQLHLICKDLLDRLEGWAWGVLSDNKKYWGTLATVGARAASRHASTTRRLMCQGEEIPQRTACSSKYQVAP